ncbi:ABC transporter permease [Bacterioplanes sanyensis]|uniref:Transport permease protein n=1 Tax=Bacterioplanes sanyensis TaxID=1249553 RepID=A0A222FFV0_9GAMM|nr:ABC transporter permease [Bacterioplanes sanyensis]ASP37512.1 ABC transporter permease [Bacterioplanes sanyensis]
MNRSLLLQFTRQDLVDRHAGSSLGALWTLLLPLSQILIFSLVFSKIMGMKLHSMGMGPASEYSYSIYLIAGLLPWLAFANTINRCAGVYQEKAGLISKVQLSLMGLPLYIPVSESVLYAIGMSFFAIFLLAVGFPISWQWLWLPLLFALVMLVAFTVGLASAILNVFIRDTRELVGLVMQIAFWATPIVYVADMIDVSWHWLFDVNPMFHLISAFRRVIVEGQAPDALPLLMIAAVTALLLGCTVMVGRRLERDIRDFI